MELLLGKVVSPVELLAQADSDRTDHARPLARRSASGRREFDHR